MELKKTFRELIKYGSQNEKNRKQVMESAIWIIGILNQTQGKQLSDEDLNKISAGVTYLFAPHFN